MIDVHALANRSTSLVNPNAPITWVRSAGYTTAADGSRTPATTIAMMAGQVQGLTSEDLRQTDGLNISGVKRSVILRGDIEALVRADGRGGDVLQFRDSAGTVRDWLVVLVQETWPTWCRVIVVQQ